MEVVPERERHRAGSVCAGTSLGHIHPRQTQYAKHRVKLGAPVGCSERPHQHAKQIRLATLYGVPRLEHVKTSLDKRFTQTSTKAEHEARMAPYKKTPRDVAI